MQMSTFTIDTDNNITALPGLPGDADKSTSFASQKELAKLTAEWPASRVVDVWNSFAGVAPFDDLKPVQKFTDRKAAVARIWKAIQRLAPTDADTAPQKAAAVPSKKRSKKPATKPKRRDTKPTGAKTPCDGNKKAEVLTLMRRAKGVTLAEIMKATGWQKHTVRGFVSILGSTGKRSNPRRAPPGTGPTRSPSSACQLSYHAASLGGGVLACAGRLATLRHKRPQGRRGREAQQTERRWYLVIRAPIKALR
jgi:hypothetical protein